MHARVNPYAKDPKDNRQLLVNGSPQLEYDGLHQGELAWVLGRRLKPGAAEAKDMNNPHMYTHQAMAGMGHGVDRMQRLASTGWMEALFMEKLGQTQIKLHEIRVDNKFALTTDASIEQFSKYISGGTCLQVPDITWWRARLENKPETDAVVGYDSKSANNNAGRRLQGIDVVATGPFLRGIQVDSKIVRFKSAVKGSTSPEDMPRNLGDSIAFAALEAEMRKKNFMDWSPDGIVLSKLESPTDEPMKSAEHDARQAQLFNVGVQGPSITTAWTSDVKDYKLEVQPLDKVFVCVKATLTYYKSDALNDDFKALRTAQQAVLKAMQEHHEAAANGDQSAMKTKMGELTSAMKEANAKATKFAQDSDKPGFRPEYIRSKEALQKKEQDLAAAIKTNTGVDAARQAVQTAKDKLNESLIPASAKDIVKIQERSEIIRTNKSVLTQAVLSDFKLMRTTSSHMANYSHYIPGDDTSRLGLKIYKHTGADSEYNGVSEVIVGGWCIGTVLDSAATRSTIGFQTVKSHPTSMAINLNVNVQWWSGDKLYKHYMDTGGQVLRRGQKRTLIDIGSGSTPKLSSVPKEDLDITPEDADAGTNVAPTVAAAFIDPLEQRVVSQRVSQAGSSSAFAAAPSRQRGGVSRRA